MTVPLKDILENLPFTAEEYTRMFREACQNHGLTISQGNKGQYENEEYGFKVEVILLPRFNNAYTYVRVEYRPQKYDDAMKVFIQDETFVKRFIVPTEVLDSRLEMIGMDIVSSAIRVAR
ncbi:MAG: hypothetical protein QXM92_03510 [Candidatus Anstonellales archaeon]